MNTTKILPGRTLVYTDPRGVSYPQIYCFKGKEIDFPDHMLEMLGQHDPDVTPVTKEVEDITEVPVLETSEVPPVETTEDTKDIEVPKKVIEPKPKKAKLFGKK